MSANVIYNQADADEAPETSIADVYYFNDDWTNDNHLRYLESADLLILYKHTLTVNRIYIVHVCVCVRLKKASRDTAVYHSYINDIKVNQIQTHKNSQNWYAA